MVPSRTTDVPRGVVVASAVCVTPAFPIALSWIVLFAPLDESVPVTLRIRLSVRLPEPAEVPLRIDW